jgi:hypothetical protein
MDKKFNLVSGIFISCLDGIYEGYIVFKSANYSKIVINVSAENIDMVFRSLCKEVRQPGL